MEDGNRYKPKAKLNDICHDVIKSPGGPTCYCYGWLDDLANNIIKSIVLVGHIYCLDAWLLDRFMVWYSVKIGPVQEK